MGTLAEAHHGRIQGPSPLCADVAIPLPVPELFSYLIPTELEESAKVGVRVRVPFKNREIVGYLVQLKPVPQDKPLKLKPILATLDAEPVLTPEILALTAWIHGYYGSSWGEAIENALPRWVKYGKKAEQALAKTSEAASQAIPRDLDLALTSDQKKALDAIQRALARESPKPILLYGVTGSGKSEIYIRAIREVLEKGKSAICLVPEIALTEQIRRFFLGHFGHELEVLHSKLSASERFYAWKRIECGSRHVVLGPRSAVFAPVRRLGLLIMDEEHEGSYKQETAPRYHAREVAKWRAEHQGALFLMGTATPSLESMHLAELGAYERMDLATRVDQKAMPEVRVIDLKDFSPSGPKMTIFSPPLATEIEANLRRKEGTLLLLNRRGFSTHIQCPKCGTVAACTACHVSLTFHQEEAVLLCHYCNLRKPVPEVCAHCGAAVLRFLGYGTEKVESELARRFPRARIARLDTDTVRRRGSHEKILKDFREEHTDILIGTQMIAKGFDFPHVTLVGVILADVGLMLPDFRSAERTFQLLTQVAGRAGRGKVPGRVLIQTYSPAHSSIRFAKDHDYLEFYRHETSERLEHRYPPFCRLINFVIRSRTEQKSHGFARTLRDLLRQELPEKDGTEGTPSFEIIGPAPLPFYKLRGHYRWHVMVKASKELGISPALAKRLAALKKPSGVAWIMDVDPFTIL